MARAHGKARDYPPPHPTPPHPTPPHPTPPHPTPPHPQPVTKRLKKMQNASKIRNNGFFSIAALLINDSSVGKVGHTGARTPTQVYIYCGMPLARWQDLGSPDPKKPKKCIY